jgi:hypothetical protein
MPDASEPKAKVRYGISDPFLGEPEEQRTRAAFTGAAAALREPAFFSYKAFPSELSEQLKEAAPARRHPAPGEVEKRAVWIVHGMGQQIPFETVDSLTEGIMSVAKYPAGATEFSPQASSIRVGDQVLQRVELKVRSADGKKDVELHLYEAYWAPLTEGVSKLSDVVGFLVNGSIRGLLNSIKPFQRAMFGNVCKFKVKKDVPVYIGIVLAVLAALTIVNLAILAGSGSKAGILNWHLNSSMPGWPAITAVASLMTALAISLGAVLFLAEMARAWSDYRGSGRSERVFLAVLSWFGVAAATLGIVGTAAVFILAGIWRTAADWLTSMPTAQLQVSATLIILFILILIAAAMCVRARKRSETKDEVNARNKVRRRIAYALLTLALTLMFAAIASWITALAHIAIPALQDFSAGSRAGRLLSSSWWVWPFLIFLSAQVRTIMVEYVGDVVVYVTSNKIDRFDEVRKKIKATAYKSASAVFLAQSPSGNHFEYESVAIVGHSLGSVIAYDTLNALINDDRLTSGKLRIAERTCLLETFGSPLNKIAFFFTIQGTDSFQMREQLAESVQPLIMNYGYRPHPWVNVRSKNDIISGEMYFYDWPSATEKLGIAPPSSGMPPHFNPVRDEVDPNASVALAAHVDYWKNPLIWQELYKHVAA